MLRLFRIRLIAAAVAAGATWTVGGIAAAQTTGPDAPVRGYAEAMAQSAFGNVTSQAYSGELGWTVWRTTRVFAEGGEVRNVATDAIGAGAQLIAAALTQIQGAAVTYSVRQPVAFFQGGVRYPFALEQSSLRPYVLAGAGVARVRNDVTFEIGGADASATLAQYVTLGSDLSGTFTKPLFTFGGGVEWPAWERLLVDVQYRFGRILADGGGISVSRAGLGIGVTF